MTKKYCPRCKKKKEKAEFSGNSRRKDGLQGACIPCMKKYRREHYRKDKQRYIDRAIKSKARTKKYYLSVKDGQPCVDCGKSYPGEPYLMDFDHLRDKTVCVSRMISSGIPRIKKEIEKCELVCVICHRRRTYKRTTASRS